ncbi:WD40 repeat domain-containing protein, partial [Azotobacter beijerinckii]
MHWLVALLLAWLANNWWLRRRSYRRGITLAQLRDNLFRATGWIGGMALGELVGSAVFSAVRSAAWGIPLEPLDMPLGVLTGLGLALTLGVGFQGAPNQFARWRVEGRVSEAAVEDVLVLGGIALPLVWIPVTMLESADGPAIFALPTVALLVYVIVRLTPALVQTRSGDTSGTDPQTRVSAGDPIGLWLVFSQPVTTSADIRLICRLARHWSGPPISGSFLTGTFTLVAPSGSRIAGEHLILAHRLGRLGALFPRLEIEIRDWLRTLPTPGHWSGLWRRELYPAPALLPTAVSTLVGECDGVALVARHFDDVEVWRGHLPVGRVRVLWLGEEPVPAEVSGYPAVRLETSHPMLWFGESMRTVEPTKPSELSSASLPIELPHHGKVYFAVFSPNGRRVVTASGDGAAHLWDADSGRALGEPLRHEGMVWHVAFSPDGRRVVTASRDGTARLWDAESGRALSEPLRHESWVWRATFSPDGRRVVTASEDKTARLWDVE